MEFDYGEHVPVICVGNSVMDDLEWNSELLAHRLRPQPFNFFAGICRLSKYWPALTGTGDFEKSCMKRR